MNKVRLLRFSSRRGLRTICFATVILNCLVSQPLRSQSEDLDSMLLLKFLPKSWVSKLFASPSLSSLPHNRVSDEIRYGYELITDTARYIGPQERSVPIREPS